MIRKKHEPNRGKMKNTTNRRIDQNTFHALVAPH